MLNRMEAVQKIEGLDVAKGLELFGGNEDMYFDMLRSFTVGNKPFFRYSKEGISAESLKDYAVAAHGIKGSCSLVCAEEVVHGAEKLKEAADAGDYAYVRELNPVFTETLEKLITDLRDLFAQIDAENPKPQKEKPDHAVLAELHRACREYDMDGVDAAMTELARYRYTSDETLARWLTEKIYEFRFSEIARKISDITDGG